MRLSFSDAFLKLFSVFVSDFLFIYYVFFVFKLRTLHKKSFNAFFSIMFVLLRLFFVYHLWEEMLCLTLYFASS